MALQFVPMDLATSRHIADSWHYPAPYDFHDMTADPDDYDEFVDPSQWPNHFYRVIEGQELVGFLSAAAEGSIYEVALGMRPDLTSQGLGLAFIQAGLSQLAAVTPSDSRLVLDVATFNVRAIRVYERAGFVTVNHFQQATNGGLHEFVRMELAAR